MERWRKILLAILVIAMILGIILTWGSIFSILMAMGILSTGAILLYQRFLLDERDNDDWGDPNG